MSRLSNDDIRVSIMAEITELEDLLAIIPEDNVIDRKSLEARLESIKAELAEADKYVKASAAAPAADSRSA